MLKGTEATKGSEYPSHSAILTTVHLCTMRPQSWQFFSLQSHGRGTDIASQLFYRAPGPRGLLWLYSWHMPEVLEVLLSAMELCRWVSATICTYKAKTQLLIPLLFWWDSFTPSFVPFTFSFFFFMWHASLEARYWAICNKQRHHLVVPGWWSHCILWWRNASWQL